MTTAPTGASGGAADFNKNGQNIGGSDTDETSLPHQNDIGNSTNADGDEVQAVSEPIHRPDFAGLVERLGIEPPAYACISAQTPDGWRDAGVDWDVARRKIAERPLSAISSVYIASGEFKPDCIVNSKGRDRTNVFRVLFFGTDCDLCTLLAFERNPDASIKDHKNAAKWIKERELHVADDGVLREGLARLGDVMESARVAANLPTPTAIVESGYGRYFWYGVETADGPFIDLCDAAAKVYIERFNAAARTLLGAPEFFNLSDIVGDAGTRVFRIPGTLNGKNSDRPRLCRWIDVGSGRALTLADLKALVAPVPAVQINSSESNVERENSTGTSASPRSHQLNDAALEMVPTRAYARDGKEDGCHGCGRALRHGYRHQCGADDCVVCPYPDCAKPAKWCANPNLPPAGCVPPLPADLDREAAAIAGTATTEPLAVVMGKGLFAYDPGPFEVLSGAVMGAHAYFSQPAKAWGFGTEEAPHPLDEIFAGFRDDESFLGVVIAAPGGWKSALGIDAAYAVAARRREPVLYVGFEEGVNRRILRLLANRARLPLRDAAFAGNNDRTQARLDSAAELLLAETEMLHFLCGQRSLSPTSIAHAAMQISGDPAAIPFIVVDALQNIAPLTPERDRRREIDAIMHGLEWIRDHMPARILLLTHAARGDGDGGYNVSLTGAKESSGIEYAADLALALRTEFIDDGRDPALIQLTVCVEKNRTGFREKRQVAIEPAFGRIRAWTDDDAVRAAAANAKSEAEAEENDVPRKKRRRK